MLSAYDQSETISFCKAIDSVEESSLEPHHHQSVVGISLSISLLIFFILKDSSCSESDQKNLRFSSWLATTWPCYQLWSHTYLLTFLEPFRLNHQFRTVNWSKHTKTEEMMWQNHIIRLFLFTKQKTRNHVSNKD